MTTDTRTLAAVRRVVGAAALDLSGLTVYTEAATGGYAVTAGIAAFAGARRVYALAGDSPFGSAAAAAEQTLAFAARLEVSDRVLVTRARDPLQLAEADIVTNSGHVRPLDDAALALLKPTAVVPLMYESWELRPQDLDLAACRRRGVAVAGTDEDHPEVGILRYLGMMALKLLLDGAVEVVGSRIAVWSDIKFCRYVAPVLAAAGAEVLVACPPSLLGDARQAANVRHVCGLRDLPAALPAFAGVDAVLLVMSPAAPVWIGEAGGAVVAAADLAAVAPGAVVAQYWGQVHRPALSAAGLASIPATEPRAHHMGVLPSALGTVPIVRLQAGGLKVGEIMARERLAGGSPHAAVEAAVRAGYGQAVEPAAGEVSHA
ncbi:MAG TPA: hypothetical protein VEW03_07920 [Longimicrobiaceae bacterium]|nr:hypothetical protein [Longimicrobiaceae bacterium]